MFKPQIIRVTSQVYCVRRPSYLTCSYVVARPKGVVLVDAGMRSDGSDMIFALEQLGLQPEKIKAILITHWHGDHSAGARVLQDLSGCRIYYQSKEKPYLFGLRKISFFRNWLAGWVPEFGIFTMLKGLLRPVIPKPIRQGTVVADGQTLEGDFLAVSTPGHTEGHMSYFYKPQDCLFAGDALAVVHGEIRLMSRPVTPDIPKSLASVERCLKTKMKVLCPGHREPMVKDVKIQKEKLLKQIKNKKEWPIWG